MLELLKFLYKVIRHLVKHILILLKKFLIWTWQSLSKFGRWTLRPKVYKTFLGILAFSVPLAIERYYHYYPDIVVNYTEPLDSKNVFTSFFVLENNGNSNIYDVQFEYELTNVMFESKTVKNSSFKDVLMSSKSPLYKRIAANKSQTVNVNLLDKFFGKNIQIDLVSFSANLKIVLHYTYWNNVKESDTLNFVSSGLVDENIIWLKNQ